MGVAEGNVGLAFGLVFAAGLSTTIGATFAFCSDLASPKMLAAALGISAGVMLYVSFAEIFCVKALEGFATKYDEDTALRYATFCFFAGIAITYVLDKLVHAIGAIQHSKSGTKHEICCRTDLDFQGQTPASGSQADLINSHELAEAGQVKAEDVGVAVVPAGTAVDEEKKRELQNMGLLTGLAIALHNFPEGLATFVASLADSKLGISLAIAIAIHNVPEGICVAMPVYYATGSKWKGFWWSFASGISEPIGGLFGYLVLYGNKMSDIAYGTLFGIVGGMMVYIALKELLPTALKYDPDDKVVTNCVFIGMGIMAASLLLFVV